MQCPGARRMMKVISFIHDPFVIRRILTHLGLPVTESRPPPARLGRRVEGPSWDDYAIDPPSPEECFPESFDPAS